MNRGGSYTKDPKTGKTTLKERTLSEAEAAEKAKQDVKTEEKKAK
jgi:hypothetical protein